MRLPLLSGSRVPLVTVADDAVLLAPPPPLDPLLDVGAAVLEALRYPLSGPALAELTTPGGSAAIVVEPRSLPLPGVDMDPRQEAVAAVVAELERLGMPARRHTIVIAGGLERRAGRRQVEGVLRPLSARDFRGAVVVHDVAADELGVLELVDGSSVSINRALLDADVVVCVTAAETTERGGPCALLAACSAGEIASVAPAPSLLMPSLSPTGDLAGRISAVLSRRTPLVGVSIVLDHPRALGRYRGYPWSPAGVEAVARSPLRRITNLLPGDARSHLLQNAGRELNAVAALAGPPAVAHAEALLRGVALREIRLDRELDTIVVPLPWSSLHERRERMNPITAAATGLGHVLRLWRDAPPLREGGTIVLLHDFSRTFGNGPGAPYRELFHVLRGSGVEEQRLRRARAAAGRDEKAIAAYRQGHAPHPLLPYLDLESCGPALDRVGSVLVAGCRDAGAARALGLVPTHNVATALEMARGVAGGSHRLGVMLAPPYPPVEVGGDQDSA